MKSNKKKVQNSHTHPLPPKRGLGAKLLARIIMFLARRRTKIHFKGQENIPAGLPYVLAPNHQTYMDGLLVAEGLPKGHFKYLCAMIGADLKTDYGLIGKVMLPISRGIEVERYGNPVRGLVMACRTCKAGNIILVHPEGTRTHDGLVGPLLSGSAYISKKCDAPLIPVYIEGGFEFFSRYDKWPRRRNPLTGKKFEITIIYGAAMHAEDYADAHVLTDALKSWYETREKEYLAKNKGKLRDVFALQQAASKNLKSE